MSNVTSAFILFIGSVKISRLSSLSESLTDVSHPASAHRHKGWRFLITDFSHTSFYIN